MQLLEVKPAKDKSENDPGYYIKAIEGKKERLLNTQAEMYPRQIQKHILFDFLQWNIVSWFAHLRETCRKQCFAA